MNETRENGLEGISVMKASRYYEDVFNIPCNVVLLVNEIQMDLDCILKRGKVAEFIMPPRRNFILR